MAKQMLDGHRRGGGARCHGVARPLYPYTMRPPRGNEFVHRVGELKAAFLKQHHQRD